MTIEDRFWAKVNRSGGPDACWPWMGYVNPEGYGRTRVAGHDSGMAHRIAFEFVVGRVPAGLELDHLCRNPPCVNPAHLEPVTHRENVLRGQSVVAFHATKTACLRGHPFTHENTNRTSEYRRCRTCDRDKKRVRRAQELHVPQAPRLGTLNGRAKLTELEVHFIRIRRAEGEPYTDIARDYDVDPTTIRRICLRKRWSHVQ